MNNGVVYREDDKFESIKAELAAQGIVIETDNEGKEKRRTRDSWRVFSRLFDGGDWLKAEEETAFDFIPLIPIYGNFDIFDNKSIYYGKLEKLFDQQRVLNYAMSRDIEDGALSPSPSIWMTAKQAEGYDYSEMNTDHAPVRLFNFDPEQPIMPQQIGSPQVSSGLQATIAMTREMIGSSANIFLAQQGNAAPSQSGVAGMQQINQGNIGSIKWFKALEVAICHTAKILVNAIPRVYDSTRQTRILEEDGTSSIVTLNQIVFDQQSQKNIEINNLTIGDYDVICDVGPAFNSQQKETAQAFLDMAAIVPEFAQTGMDIWLKNLSIPGMAQMAERFREQLINGGFIPRSQFTDEEESQAQQAEAQAQEKPPEPDPNALLAQAEILKGQAAQQQANNKQTEIQGNQQLKSKELDLEQNKLQLDVDKFKRLEGAKFNVDAANIQQNERKLDQTVQKMLIEAQQTKDKLDLQAEDQRFTQFIDTQEILIKNLSEQSNTLKILVEVLGADGLVGPGTIKTAIQQSRVVAAAQEDLPKTGPDDIEIAGLNENEEGAS